jgi:hypothetical protein
MVFLEILCSSCEFWIYYEVSGSLLLVLGLCSGPHLTYFHIEIYPMFFNIMAVYHNHIGPLSLTSKVLFLLKIPAGLSSLLGAQVVYLEVMRPFAEMALYRYVFFSLGKG